MKPTFVIQRVTTEGKVFTKKTQYATEQAAIEAAKAKTVQPGDRLRVAIVDHTLEVITEL